MSSKEKLKNDRRNLEVFFGKETSLEESAKQEFCQFWGSKEEAVRVTDIEFKAIRDQIVEICSVGDGNGKEKNLQFVFPKKDFDARDITSARVYTILKCIDVFYFKNSLIPFLSNTSCGQFCIEICDEFKEDDEQESLAFFQNSMFSEDFELLKKRHGKESEIECPAITDQESFFGIRIQRKLWGDAAQRRSVDGVIHLNKLSSFVAVLCHEITHVLNYIICHDGSHSKQFTQMNAAFFGHSSRKFESRDLP